MNRLEKKEIVLINQLMKITNNILTFNLNLLNPDIISNEEEYQKQIKYLKLYLELEKEIYKNIYKLGIDKINTFKHLIDQDQIFYQLSDYDLIIHHDIELIPFKRMYNQLTKIETSLMIESYQEFMEPNEKKDSFDYVTFLKTTIEEDFTKLFIFYQKELLENPLYLKYHDTFKKSIQMITFLNPSININDYLYLHSKTCRDLLGISKSIHEKEVKLFYQKNIESYVTRLLDMENSDLKEEKSLLLSLYYQVLIKAYLTLPSVKRKEIKEKMYDIIKGNKNKKSIRILTNLLNQEKSDKILILQSERLMLNGSRK